MVEFYFNKINEFLEKKEDLIESQEFLIHLNCVIDFYEKNINESDYDDYSFYFCYMYCIRSIAGDYNFDLNCFFNDCLFFLILSNTSSAVKA